MTFKMHVMAFSLCEQGRQHSNSPEMIVETIRVYDVAGDLGRNLQHEISLVDCRRTHIDNTCDCTIQYMLLL